MCRAIAAAISAKVVQVVNAWLAAACRWIRLPLLSEGSIFAIGVTRKRVTFGSQCNDNIKCRDDKSLYCSNHIRVLKTVNVRIHCHNVILIPMQFSPKNLSQNRKNLDEVLN